MLGFRAAPYFRADDNKLRFNKEYLTVCFNFDRVHPVHPFQRNMSGLFSIIRGPTHITQTDVWVSRGDTLSLFKRRVDLIGNWCTASSSKVA